MTFSCRYRSASACLSLQNHTAHCSIQIKNSRKCILFWTHVHINAAMKSVLTVRWPAAGNERWAGLYGAGLQPLSWGHLETSDSASEFLTEWEDGQEKQPLMTHTSVLRELLWPSRLVQRGGFVLQGRHHWSHWLYCIDLTEWFSSGEKGKEWADVFIKSTTWGSMKGINNRRIWKEVHPAAIKAASKHLTLNNDKQPAPALTANVNTEAQWELVAVTWAESSNTPLKFASILLWKVSIAAYLGSCWA